jgi:hypothetical protein
MVNGFRDLRENIHLPPRSCFKQDLYPRVNLPDFMTRASRELIDSAVFFDFFGGMLMVSVDDLGTGLTKIRDTLSQVVTAI